MLYVQTMANLMLVVPGIPMLARVMWEYPYAHGHVACQAWRQQQRYGLQSITSPSLSADG